MYKLRLVLIPFLLALLFINNTAQSASTLVDMQGNKIPFNSLQGKWVMINYWASWCQPCLDEIRALNKFYAQHHNEVALFAVNFDALSVEEQIKLTQYYGIKYPGLQENPASELQLGDIRGVPATFVFSPEGALSQTLYGPQTLASLRSAIKK